MSGEWGIERVLVEEMEGIGGGGGEEGLGWFCIFILSC